MQRRLRLIIRSGDIARTLDLGAAGGEGSLTIGRSLDQDLVLDDPAISRSHCKLTWKDGAITLEDRGSRGGTFVSGTRLEQATALEDGNTFTMGSHAIEVRVEQPEVGSETLDGSQLEATREDAALSATMIQSGSLQLRSSQEQIEVDVQGTIILGRDPMDDVTLSHPTISRSHAELTREGKTVWLRDLASTNGTFVGGERIERHELRAGETVRIGPYELAFDGRCLRSVVRDNGTRISVAGLGKEVKDRESGTPLHILTDIHLTIEPREFVGLLGASGCGKSTFMDAINGRRPATQGAVFYNGQNLYNQFEAFKRGIGYVPQEPIFHRNLPLDSALRYASRLRLPEDTTALEIDQNIERVLDIVGLKERRHTIIAYLSGGQRKRVSIAMELLSRPSVLFLDEATSGLDLGTEAQMMQLFRSLADSGVTTLCITHFVDSLEVCDLVAYFVKGRLVYYGPPADLKDHFGVAHLRDVYLEEESKSPERWEAAFRASQVHARYVEERASRQGELDHVVSRKPPEEDPVRNRNSRSARQFSVLCKRYVQVLLGDRRNVLLLLSLAPLIAALVSLALPGREDQNLLEQTARQGQLAFILTLVAFFLGIFSSIREVIKELPIYLHERFVGLEVLPYLFSKALPLMVLGAIQTTELLAVTHWLTDCSANPALQFIFLFATYVAAMWLGLAISASVSSADKAILLMIIAIIPQLLFANAFIELRGAGKLVGQTCITAYWGHDGMKNLLPEEQLEARDPLSGKEILFGHHPVHIDLLILIGHSLVFLLFARTMLLRKDGPYQRAWLPLLRRSR